MRRSDPKKAAKLKGQRGATPEEVVEGGEYLPPALENKNYPGQKLELYWFQNYVWIVVVEGERLVTTYPSRKLTKERKK